MRKWQFYTTNEIKPAGWMQQQLKIQADGLSGNLDKVWRDIRDSKWIGGKAEGWERVPYWLDGFIPLAYLLDDKDMINRAKKYIDAIISSQQDDGWICPCNKAKRPVYDTWAVQLITKVLCVYYHCSGDEKIIDVIYKTLKNYYEMLSSGSIRLFAWGKYRWFEAFEAINLIYERFNEDWLVELAAILKKQGKNYSELTDKWLKPSIVWNFDTHIVNITMMLKAEAVTCDILGNSYNDIAQKLYNILYSHNGTPVGLFTGDECLSGISPIQGTELCAVVEQMYSYEQLFAYTGDSKWAERLELLSFNALPATLSDDMWAHQYVQMSNQIACQKLRGKPIFRTNSGEAHLFGLEPHYGCCTANFNQGFPKLMISSFMHNDNAIINVLPIASRLSDNGVNIIVNSEYPFRNIIEYVIDAERAFNFIIRIPSFAENTKIDGNIFKGNEYTVHIEKCKGKRIVLSFNTTPHFEKSLSGLTYAKCGSLIYAVPINYEKQMKEYKKHKVERRYPYCDYEYIPTSDWSYAYCDKEMTLVQKELSNIPFSSNKPPVVLEAYVKKIDWGYERKYKSICAKKPLSTQALSDELKIELYPYGCAKLRVTELEILKSKE